MGRKGGRVAGRQLSLAAGWQLPFLSRRRHLALELLGRRRPVQARQLEATSATTVALLVRRDLREERHLQ